MRSLQKSKGAGGGDGTHGGGGDILFEVTKEISAVTGGVDTPDIGFHH